MSYEIITPDEENLYLNIHIKDTLENRKLCWDFIDKLKEDTQNKTDTKLSRGNDK